MSSLEVLICNILGCAVGHIQPVGAWRNSFHPIRFVIVFHFTLLDLLFALNGCRSCSRCPRLAHVRVPALRGMA